jgi:hypothetical protein
MLRSLRAMQQDLLQRLLSDRLPKLPLLDAAYAQISPLIPEAVKK